MMDAAAETSAVAQYPCRPARSESLLKGSRLNELPNSCASYRPVLAERRFLAPGRFLFDVGDDVYLGAVGHRIFIRRVGWALTGCLRHVACRASSASTAPRRPRPVAQRFMSHRGSGRGPVPIGRHRRSHLRWLGIPSTRSDCAVSRLEPGDGADIWKVVGPVQSIDRLPIQRAFNRRPLDYSLSKGAVDPGGPGSRLGTAARCREVSRAASYIRGRVDGPSSVATARYPQFLGLSAFGAHSPQSCLRRPVDHILRRWGARLMPRNLDIFALILRRHPQRPGFGAGAVCRAAGVQSKIYGPGVHGTYSIAIRGLVAVGAPSGRSRPADLRHRRFGSLGVVH